MGSWGDLDFSNLIIVTKVVESLMVCKMNMIKELIHPSHIRPEEIPFQLTLGFNPSSSFQHFIYHRLLPTASELDRSFGGWPLSCHRVKYECFPGPRLFTTSNQALGLPRCSLPPSVNPSNKALHQRTNKKVVLP
jgi:hypothetical protein